MPQLTSFGTTLRNNDHILHNATNVSKSIEKYFVQKNVKKASLKDVMHHLILDNAIRSKTGSTRPLSDLLKRLDTMGALEKTNPSVKKEVRNGKTSYFFVKQE